MSHHLIHSGNRRRSRGPKSPEVWHWGRSARSHSEERDEGSGAPRGACRAVCTAAFWALVRASSRARETRRLSAHRLRRFFRCPAPCFRAATGTKSMDPGGFRRRSLRPVQPFKADPRSGDGRLAGTSRGTGHEPARGRRANRPPGLIAPAGPTGSGAVSPAPPAAASAFRIVSRRRPSSDEARR